MVNGIPVNFIDLFSGIGGFHQALTNSGDHCVLASEIDADCINVYQHNYHLNSGINVRELQAEDIPEFDVLCGGFPCQAFSKARQQRGMQETRGTLFFEIQRILEARHPRYIVLENVRNLVSHDGGNTWAVITNNLRNLGYRLTAEPLILSPHQFGIPQLRERVYILGYYDPEHVNEPLEIELPKLMTKDENDAYSIIDADNNDPALVISEYERYVLTAWDEFYQGIEDTTIGFPIWLDYMFFEGDISEFPAWKQEFIRKNKDLYARNQAFIDEWMHDWNNLENFTPTHRKFEWQAGNKIDTIWEGIIQFRPSGIRVKAPTVFPALVAMVQIPIIGRYARRLSVRECARLQSFPDTFQPSENRQQAYKQFGNSVNVHIVELLYAQLTSRYHE